MHNLVEAVDRYVQVHDAVKRLSQAIANDRVAEMAEATAAARVAATRTEVNDASKLEN